MEVSGRPARQPGPLGERTELVGALHFHTHFSDGSGDGRTLASAAAAAGLDFIVPCDHDTLALREAGQEGWHGCVLVACGTEIAAEGNQHLVALGNRTAARRYSLTVEEALVRVRGEGGAILAAHPHGRGLFGRKKPLEKWPFWDHPQLSGLELWNYLQDWAESFRPWDRNSFRVGEIAARIKGPPDWLLALWDAQAAKRPFPAVAGNDNHAKRLFIPPWRFFPHEQLVGRLVNRVRLEKPLPADGAAAAGELFAALGSGRVTISREELAPSAGFDFRVELADGRQLRSGDTALFAPGARAIVVCPREAELRVISRGRLVEAKLAGKLEVALESPGPVRAEARLGGRAWIFSNHVRLS